MGVEHPRTILLCSVQCAHTTKVHHHLIQCLKRAAEIQAGVDTFMQPICMDGQEEMRGGGELSHQATRVA